MSDDLRIISVHGTWGQGFISKDAGVDKWFNPQSKFSIDIIRNLSRRGVEARFLPPCLWSGSNSIEERYKAAQSLKEQIEISLSENDTPILVIAHSHGGNALMKCLSILNEDVSSHVRFVTLATPFLKLFEIGYFDSRLRYLARIAWVEVLFVAIAMSYSLLTVLSATILPNSWYFSAFILVLILSLCASLGLVIFIFDGPSSFYYYKRFNEESTRISKLVEMSNCVTEKCSSFRGLIVRGPEDEASLTLALGSLQAKIFSVVTSSFSGLLVFPWGILWIYPIFALMGLVISEEPIWARICALLFLGAGIVYIILPILAVLSKGAFAKELLRGSARCELSADSVPEGNYNLTIRTIPTGRSGFRHSIYNDPQTVDVISEFIALELNEVKAC